MKDAHREILHTFIKNRIEVIAQLEKLGTSKRLEFAFGWCAFITAITAVSTTFSPGSVIGGPVCYALSLVVSWFYASRWTKLISLEKKMHSIEEQFIDLWGLLITDVSPEYVNGMIHKLATDLEFIDYQMTVKI